jgi:hypothetical protein
MLLLGRAPGPVPLSQLGPPHSDSPSFLHALTHQLRPGLGRSRQGWFLVFAPLPGCQMRPPIPPDPPLHPHTRPHTCCVQGQVGALRVGSCDCTSSGCQMQAPPPLTPLPPDPPLHHIHTCAHLLRPGLGRSRQGWFLVFAPLQAVKCKPPPPPDPLLHHKHTPAHLLQPGPGKSCQGWFLLIAHFQAVKCKPFDPPWDPTPSHTPTHPPAASRAR